MDRVGLPDPVTVRLRDCVPVTEGVRVVNAVGRVRVPVGLIVMDTDNVMDVD